MKNNKKIIVAISLVVALLVITLGTTYAAFVYRENTNNQQLVLGEIYMYYNEINQLTIENAMPGDDYSNYFEFTVSGMNTYNQKDIYYEVVLTKGDTPEDKLEANRLSDESLLFKLVEVADDDTETILLEDKTYDDLTSQRLYVATIEKGTTQEVNKTYRLYARIGDNITICGGEITEGCDYFTSGETLNWTDAFASVKVSVTGDFTKKGIPTNFVNLVKTKYGNDTTLVAVNGEGTLYDASDDTQEIREYRYSGPTANNYVFFDTNGDGTKTDDEIWRIVGVFKDTIKDEEGNVVLENGQPTYEEKVKLMRNTWLTSAELPATYTINGTANTIEYNTTGTAYWNKKDSYPGLQNDWTTAGLQYYLNTEQDESATPNPGYLSFLSTEAKELLSLTTYHLGNVVYGYSGDTAISAYINERGTTVCESSVTSDSHNSNCNIWYGNEASWNGYVGLLYPSDYGYSATNTYWSTLLVYYNSGAMNTSWMQQTANHSNSEWLLSPSSYGAYIRAVYWDTRGVVSYNRTDSYYGARGVINLISSATVLDAAGTIDEPYIVVVE